MPKWHVHTFTLHMRGLVLRLSFRTKTNVVFAIALAALASVGFLSFRETARLVEADRWASHSREVLAAATSMASHLSDAIAARRGYLLFGKPQDLNNFAVASRWTLMELDSLRALTADNSTQQACLRALAPVIQSRLATLQQSIELHQHSRDGNDAEVQVAMSNRGAELEEQISGLQKSFRDTESGLLTQRLIAAAATVRRTFRIEGALAVSVFGILIAALAFINREISLRESAERASMEKERLLRSVLDSGSDPILVSDEQGKIILRNAVAARYHMDLPRDVPPESRPQEFGVFQRDKKTLVPAGELPLARAAIRGESVDNFEMYIRPPSQDHGRWYLASARPLLDSAGRRRGGLVVLRDVTERKILEEDRDRLIVELYKSIANVKTLTGLLPICAGCKKIRDDKGYWTQVEDYISEHSDVTFSHGLCPECVRGLYPEVAEKKDIP